MRNTAKPHDEKSPLAILTELAVEGTSSFVEAQRTLLDLAQQENDIILNGVKDRVGSFVPAAAMTDLVRRGLDTVIGMQQEFLTATSRQTLNLLEPDKGDRSAQLVSFAREGVEAFTRAQKKFLEVVAQESAKFSGGKQGDITPSKKAEVADLAHEAGNAFIEAQKRLLDVMGQQMNVNLDATSKTLGLMSPARLQPLANIAGERVRDFVDAETSLFGSLGTPRKKSAARAKHNGKPKAHRKSATV